MDRSQRAPDWALQAAFIALLVLSLSFLLSVIVANRVDGLRLWFYLRGNPSPARWMFAIAILYLAGLFLIEAKTDLTVHTAFAVGGLLAALVVPLALAMGWRSAFGLERDPERLIQRASGWNSNIRGFPSGKGELMRAFHDSDVPKPTWIDVEVRRHWLGVAPRQLLSDPLSYNGIQVVAVGTVDMADDPPRMIRGSDHAGLSSYVWRLRAPGNSESVIVISRGFSELPSCRGRMRVTGTLAAANQAAGEVLLVATATSEDDVGWSCDNTPPSLQPAPTSSGFWIALRKFQNRADGVQLGAVADAYQSLGLPYPIYPVLYITLVDRTNESWVVAGPFQDEAKADEACADSRLVIQIGAARGVSECESFDGGSWIPNQAAIVGP